MKTSFFVLFLLTFTTQAWGQASFGIGVGPTLPVGDSGERLDSGFHVQGLLEFGIPLLPLGVQASATYQQMQGALLDNHQIYGSLNGRIGLPGLLFSVYFTGGPSVHYEWFENGLGKTEGATFPGLNFGIGARVTLLVVDVFAEGRYYQVYRDKPSGNLQFVPITVGFIF